MVWIPCGVETILLVIFVESLERLMHLKRKDSIKLKNIRKWMEEKYQSCMNSPSTLACYQNPMVLETTV